MRKLTVLLMLLIAVSFASDAVSALALDDFSLSSTSTGYVAPIPLSKAVLFDQAYDGTYGGGADYSGTIHEADKFSFTNPSRLEYIEWWHFSMYSDVNTFDLRVHDDNSGLPGTVLWEQLDVTAEVTDTGDAFGPYGIYHVEAVLDPADYCLLDDGTIYWLSLHHNGSDAGWCCWWGGYCCDIHRLWQHLVCL